MLGQVRTLIVVGYGCSTPGSKQQLHGVDCLVGHAAHQAVLEYAVYLDGATGCLVWGGCPGCLYAVRATCGMCL
jgi:hypothetical protein